MKNTDLVLKAAMKFTAFAVVTVLLALTASVAANGKSAPLLSLLASTGAEEKQAITVVVDPGHGGYDGGATASGGAVLEKNINLDVAKRLCFLFRAAGYDCVMTREEDVMLGEGKAYDLKNRLETTNSYENPVFISIHQNKYPDGSCRGLQVYYSKNNADSETLALYIQNVAAAYTDRENGRRIKRADSAIYLLDRLTCPAVLVECGFLSNPDECEKLLTADYQKRLAAAIFAAAADFFGQIYGNV
ncbi:MAG: N-acetylmuramoyl-L-alanine amidase [Clostridia bacterium]|nr:N-acetylmuramoyl-L-alanine amidase [Clostridia bacterium]